MTAQINFEAVKVYADQLKLTIAPRDLRRTFAKLARKGGSDLQQVHLSLAHASIQTAERYLGETQSLTNVSDGRLGLHITGD